MTRRTYKTKGGIAGEEQVIGGNKFYCLKASVASQTLSHEARVGDITYDNFKEAFNNLGGGISLNFTDTNINHAFPWRDFVEHAERLYCFGPPLDSSRRYTLAFGKDRTDSALLKQIFWNLGRETYGDSLSSSSLTLAFKNAMLKLKDIELNAAQVKDEMLSFQETDKGDLFFRVFNATCCRTFLESVTYMRDYNTPIMPLESYDVFVSKAETTFPRLWKYLSTLRNRKQHKKASVTNKITPKERQIFSQIR